MPTPLPARNIFDGTALPVTSTMKTSLGALRDYLAGLLGTTGAAVDARAALGVVQIQPIAASVAASALTCTLNPTTLEMRSATLSSGTVNPRAVAAAISLIVPSTATLGTTGALLSRLYLLAIDNAGAVELAVVNSSGGNNLDETTLISTTALSAAATAANVIYSTAARTNVAFRVVGYIESTQATAGTWTTAPSTIQGFGGNALASMSSAGYSQTAQIVTGSRAAGTTYTNSTGKEIYVSVSMINAAAGGFGGQLMVDGINMSYSFNSTTLSAGVALTTVAGPVAPGKTYSIQGMANATVFAWTERR